MRRPLLTIGMIFKNEIRCLERCLKALEPLRQAVPCELIMADTGSDDGSREVAEKYADAVFDFPWVNDFSAARNAVMERATGEWYFTVDADEYLDADISELVEFLRQGGPWAEMAGTVIQRNHSVYTMDAGYSDFAAVRLLRMSTGLRYVGSIHESWVLEGNPALIIKAFHKTVLHHDGYVGLGGEIGRAKRERNLQLLRNELQKAPRNLLLLQQYIESGMREADYLERLRYAADLVEQKVSGWERYGPPIFRYAVAAAVRQGLPEVWEWIRRAEEWFPDSYYTRIDVAALAFDACWNQKTDFSECIRWGEKYLSGCADYDADGKKMFIVATSGEITKANPIEQQSMKIFLAAAYLKEAEPGKALALLESVDFTLLDQQMAGVLTEDLLDLQKRSDLDTAPLVSAAWEGITSAVPSGVRANERRTAFLLNGALAFSAEYRRAEMENEAFLRPAYTAFLPLAGRCTLGTAAAMMERNDPEEIAGLLEEVERWNELPHPALVHAIQAGVAFPLPNRPLKLEEADDLAGRLSKDPEAWDLLLDAAAKDDFAEDWQPLNWRRALILAAVQACGWQDELRGMELAHTFAGLERQFLTRYYSPELLCTENIHVLPPLHRFGWYCARAFDALGNGDAIGYVRLLREGLSVCEFMKPMVEFLAKRTPELQAPKPSGELLALAEKVRTLLAAYAPDDPAVEALKQSDAYRKVAYLIEGPDLGLLGGLPQ